jgi:hypothetical protein
MKQVVLAGLVAGALAVGQPGAASAQAPATSGTKPQTGAGSEKASGTKPHTGASSTQASGGASLGTVHLTHAVTANGQRLAPGNYRVRLTEEQARPEAKGQNPTLERWVEFLQGSEVKGREVVSIVPESDIAQVAESKRVPNGSSRVEMLKGNDYVRVWINRGGNNYLIHLPPA